MLIDYHLHLEKGPFSLDWFEKFYNQGLKCGVKEFGISEHACRFREFENIYEGKPAGKKWFSSSFTEYRSFIKELKNKYPIKFGIEMDYFPDKEKEIFQAIKNSDFDYVLGSVHWLDGVWGVDRDASDIRWKQDYDTIAKKYFEVVNMAVKSQLFNIMAHIDLIKIWGFIPNELIFKHFKKTAKLLKENGLCVEINTAGLRRPVREIYPSRSILEELSLQDISVTFGSDAHVPEESGKDLADAYALAKSLGLKKYCTFQRGAAKYNLIT